MHCNFDPFFELLQTDASALRKRFSAPWIFHSSLSFSTKALIHPKEPLPSCIADKHVTRACATTDRQPCLHVSQKSIVGRLVCFQFGRFAGKRRKKLRAFKFGAHRGKFCSRDVAWRRGACVTQVTSLTVSCRELPQRSPFSRQNRRFSPQIVGFTSSFCRTD